MADVNHVITLGIGTPGEVPQFLLLGLSPAEASSGSGFGPGHIVGFGFIGGVPSFLLGAGSSTEPPATTIPMYRVDGISMERMTAFAVLSDRVSVDGAMTDRSAVSGVMKGT